MSQEASSLKVLGIEVNFMPGTNMEQANEAARYLENKFSARKARASHLHGKELLLVYVALGMADELLQLKNKQAELENKLSQLLAKIEESL